MPALETVDLTDSAVLWPFTGYDSYGQPTVGSPVQIKVRFLTVRREATNPKGNTVALDSIAIVDRDIGVGSHLWHGVLTDWYGTASAGTDEEVYEVKTFNTTPDVKGRNIRRSVGLMRLHNQGAD